MNKKEDEPLPVKYVDEIIKADRLRGRMMGLMAEISKRTSNPITFDDDILKKDNIFLFAFLRIAKVVTKEEQRVLNALLDEAKKMSESGLGGESEDGMIRVLELVHGWKIEANKIFDEGGCMYDLLEFTNPNLIITTVNKQSVKGFHGKLEDAWLQRFEENGKYGLKGKNGEILLPAEYDAVNHSGYAGRGWHIRKGDKWGAVNERVEWIFPIDYDDIKLRFEGGHYLKKNNKVGFCDSEGNMTVDFLYDDLENYSSSWDGFKAKVDGKWGYIDKHGNVVVPIEYEEISLGSDGMIRVKKTAEVRIDDRLGRRYLCGLYDLKNGYVLPCEYERIELRGRNREGIMECRCWKESDSEPVLVKVMSAQTLG